MKTLISALAILLSIPSFAKSLTPDPKPEICKAFAADNSGVYDEDDMAVYYDSDLAYEYCMDNAELEYRTDAEFPYYQFTLLVCKGDKKPPYYLFHDVQYNLETLELTYSVKKGGESVCPYKYEE